MKFKMFKAQLEKEIDLANQMTGKHFLKELYKDIQDPTWFFEMFWSACIALIEHDADPQHLNLLVKEAEYAISKVKNESVDQEINGWAVDTSYNKMTN